MIVGIDLGTTNSAVAFWRDGHARLIPNSLGGVLTPSAVSIDDGGIVLVGMAARERQATHPELTATAFKRYMGSRKATQLGQRSFLPEELSALVLAQLKRDAEAYLGETVTEAVITVPAYFNDKQRSATRRAGELAGLKVERLLNEPTAAALAYGIHQLGDETRFLVFDLGGGTFDVSILEIFEGVIEVRASTGDNRLGGEDFNEALVTAMRTRFAKEWGDDATTSVQLHERLRVAAERARRTLTDRNDATMDVVWRDRSFTFDVTEEDFEKLVAPLLARLRDPVVRSLRDSDVRAESLREIVLVGGATRMPVVRRIVARMFGRFPATSVNPDEAVALGAAVQAALKMRDSALKEVAVTDVCPYTLGIDTSERLPNGKYRGGIFAPIIERNTVVPASRVRTFSTITDDQKVMTFGIFQGESREVSDNISLGKISIPIPPKPAGDVDVECRFSYDINGLIEVDVHVPATGERRQLVIVDEEGPTGDDLAKRRELLASLKYHPREKDAHRATLARASRCFEDFLGDKREYVATLIAKYEASLDTQDDRAAERGRQELTAALDRLEGESYL